MVNHFPDEHMLAVKHGRNRVHQNPVECYFDSKGRLFIVFYRKFWEQYEKFVGMNDYIRFYVDDSYTYLRMQAHPVKNDGCYKMSIRPGCRNIRQIVLPKVIADNFLHHEGRLPLMVCEKQRTIVLSFPS